MEFNKNTSIETKERLNDKRLITDTNKSLKSNSSVKKRSEISPQIIFSSVERDLNDLIQEINIRTQKNKLISISESIKLLAKKITVNSTIAINENNRELSDNYYFKSEPANNEKSTKYLKEIENLNKNYENEIKKLKEDIFAIQNKLNTNVIINEYENKIQKSNENFSKISQKLDQVNYLYTEEKTKNNQLVLQIKILEEALKTLNNEYNNLSFQYGKLQKECECLEKTMSDQRKNNNDNKFKFEDLMNINSELKIKLVETEATLKLHTEDMKSLLKKMASQNKYLEELENKHKQISADLAYKEERLKALRNMNSKLEQKSNVILKKFETFKLFEEKSNEIDQNNQKMINIIEDLNSKLNIEKEEKENNRRNVEEAKAQGNKLFSDCEDLKNQIITLKSMNDELIAKNNELENKFKRTLDQRAGDSRESSFSLSKDRPQKAFYSNTLTNVNYSSNLTQKGDTHSQKIPTPSANNINELQIDEMKPAKIIITNNNVEIVNK